MGEQGIMGDRCCTINLTTIAMCVITLLQMVAINQIQNVRVRA